MEYRSVKQFEDVYRDLYGEYPDDPDAQLKYLYDNYKIDQRKVDEIIDNIKSIKYKGMTFVFNVIPIGGSRPRSTSYGITYVPNAKVHHDYFKKKVFLNKIVHTKVSFKIKTYIQIPNSMSNNEKVAAQLGFIRPMSTPDWDNLAKTYADMTIKTLLLDDNIICGGSCDKYYALKPRVEIDLKWEDKYDSNFNRKKIENSKRYKDLKGIDPKCFDI